MYSLITLIGWPKDGLIKLTTILTLIRYEF